MALPTPQNHLVFFLSTPYPVSCAGEVLHCRRHGAAFYDLPAPDPRRINAYHNSPVDESTLRPAILSKTSVSEFRSRTMTRLGREAVGSTIGTFKKVTEWHQQFRRLKQGEVLGWERGWARV